MRAWAVKLWVKGGFFSQPRGLSHTALLQAVRVRVGFARTFSMDSEGGTEVARKPPSKSSLMKLTKSELAKRLGQMGLQVRTIEGFVLLLACT
jgi:hypothetical protein